MPVRAEGDQQPDPGDRGRQDERQLYEVLAEACRKLAACKS